MRKYLIFIIMFSLLSLIIFTPNANTQVEIEQSSTVTRTASTETICNNGRCTLRLYSGAVNMLDKDGIYKPFTDVVNLTFRNNAFNISWYEGYIILEPFVIYNGVERTVSDIKLAFPNVNLKDYIQKDSASYKYALNYSGISSTLLLGVDNLGFKIRRVKGITVADVNLDGNNIIIKDKIKFSFQDLIDSGFTLNLVNKTYLLIGNIQESKGVIYLDPKVQLKDDNTENLEDTFIRSDQSTTNFGSTAFLRVSNDVPGRKEIAYIKFNLKPVPIGATITSSLLSLTAIAGETWNNVSIWQLNNQTWLEEQPTWNSPVPGAGSMINYTNVSADSPGILYFFNVTPWVKSEYNANKKNVSFKINTSTSQTKDFSSKEEILTPGSDPELNITYILGATYVRFYRNFTNTTSPVINQYIKFNINWTSNTSLSKSYFETNISGSIINYTIFSSSFNTSVKMNITNKTSNGVGRFYWKSYANDSKSTINKTTMVFIKVIDSIAPRFYNETNNLSSLNVYNKPYRLSVKWNDTGGSNIGSAHLETNITGTRRNYSLIFSPVDGSHFFNITNFTQVRRTFFWRFFANDTSNNINFTSRRNGTVDSTSPILRIINIPSNTLTPVMDVDITDNLELDVCWYNITLQSTPNNCLGTCPTYFSCNSDPTLPNLASGDSYSAWISANDTSNNINLTRCSTASGGTATCRSNWTASIGGVGGGGGGGILGTTLFAIGIACTSDEVCASGICDLNTNTCTSNLCGNNFCDRDRGENIQQCSVDCASLNEIVSGRIFAEPSIAGGTVFTLIAATLGLTFAKRKKKKKKKKNV